MLIRSAVPSIGLVDSSSAVEERLYGGSIKEIVRSINFRDARISATDNISKVIDLVP